MEKKIFTLKKNHYFVCELPDVKCQTTGRCVRRPSGVRPETKPPCHLQLMSRTIEKDTISVGEKVGE